MTPDIDLDALTTDATKAVETLRSMMATNSRDWGAARDDAWFYGLVVGWGQDPGDLPDPNDDCGDAMPELAARHGWSPETVAHLRRMHDGYVAVPALLSALTATRAELEKVTAERDEADRLSEKLTLTIRAFPHADNAANIAHARAQRDDYQGRHVQAELLLAATEHERDAARHAAEYWKGKYEAGAMDQLAAAPKPDEPAWVRAAIANGSIERTRTTVAGAGDGEQPELSGYQRQCDTVLPHGEFCTLVLKHKAPCCGKALPSPIAECYLCWTAPRYPLDARAQHHTELHRAKVAGDGEQDTATCGHTYIGNVGEFTCGLYAPHDGNHWHSLAEFDWPADAASVQGAADGEAQA